MQIAEGTAVALGEIVREVQKCSDLISEIALASNEQAQGVSQVNIGLQQIDQVIQTKQHHVEFTHIPRRQNQRADRLAQAATAQAKTMFN